MLEGKVIRVGNSAAISISKKEMEKNRLKFNQRVKFALLETNKDKIIEELFGRVPHGKPFKREEEDREF